jgi:tRNA (guanine-N(7)-)-methyltransferase
MACFNPEIHFVPTTILADHPLLELLPLPDGPVHLDLGTGLGHFLDEMARREAQVNWIGLECEGKILKRAVRRIRRAGHPNTLLFAMEARPFLLESVAPESLDHIWLNFPDPWPKKKHAPRRHTHPWTLGLLVSRLRVGGELHLATDVEDYLEEMVGGLEALEEMTGTTDTPWQRSTLGVETKYERKWKQHGRPIFYGDWRKQRAGSTDQYPFEWQAPPDLQFNRLPEAGVWGDERYCLKVFLYRRGKSSKVGFWLIDRQTGISTPGTIDEKNGGVQLKGAWTPWKIHWLKILLQEVAYGAGGCGGRPPISPSPHARL